MSGVFLKIAHRGWSAAAPENTLAAFEMAVKAGADAVEMDVRSTLDGEIVVLHDSDMDRTTDLSGPVGGKTLAEVKSADAGAWFDGRFRGERVPTLEEALDLVNGSAVAVVEIKGRGIAEGVVRAIGRAGAHGYVVVKSFDPGEVLAVQELDPSIPRALLIGGGMAGDYGRGIEIARSVARVGGGAASIAWKVISPELVDAIHGRGPSVWAWTVDDVETAVRMLDMGVDGIISNKVDILLDL